MRVAIFAYTGDAPTLETGVSTYNRELVGRLCRRYPQHSFTVYLAPENSAKFGDITCANLRKVVLPPYAGGGGGRLAKAAYYLRIWGEEALRACGLRFEMRHAFYDAIPGLKDHDVVIYTVFGYLADFPLYVKRSTAAKCVSAVHDIRFLYDDAEVRSRAMPQLRISLYLLGKIASESDYILVPSNYIKGVLTETYSGVEARTRVSFIVPEVASSVEAEEISPAVRTLLTSGTKYFFYPSTIVETKNHLALVEAMASLRNRLPDVRLVLAGSNTSSPLADRIFRRIAELGLDDCVQHLGFVNESEKVALYRSATALVVPSIGESFSLPIWEAFALGCPVVASTDRDIPEQVADAAIPCDPRDPEHIARQLERVYTEPELAASLREAGRARYEKVRRESLFSGWEAIFEEP